MMPCSSPKKSCSTVVDPTWLREESVLRDENDYDSFMEDTLKAGHYENRRESVDIMIRSSREIIRELIEYGVDFAREGEHLAYTREGWIPGPGSCSTKTSPGKRSPANFWKP